MEKSELTENNLAMLKAGINKWLKLFVFVFHATF
jgi:hypothetical protein